MPAAPRGAAQHAPRLTSSTMPTVGSSVSTMKAERSGGIVDEDVDFAAVENARQDQRGRYVSATARRRHRRPASLDSSRSAATTGAPRPPSRRKSRRRSRSRRSVNQRGAPLSRMAARYRPRRMDFDSRSPVVVLAGGTGGAKLARGMVDVAGDDLVVIANTATTSRCTAPTLARPRPRARSGWPTASTSAAGAGRRHLPRDGRAARARRRGLVQPRRPRPRLRRAARSCWPAARGDRGAGRADPALGVGAACCRWPTRRCARACAAATAGTRSRSSWSASAPRSDRRRALRRGDQRRGAAGRGAAAIADAQRHRRRAEQPHHQQYAT